MSVDSGRKADCLTDFRRPIDTSDGAILSPPFIIERTDHLDALSFVFNSEDDLIRRYSDDSKKRLRFCIGTYAVITGIIICVT